MQIKTIIQKFKELHFHEKLWVIFNPLSAKKGIQVTAEARIIANEMINNPLLDGDYNGGQVDAFRHTLWMAMLTQKIGAKKAFKLGVAHEDGNYSDFLASTLEEGTLPTYTSSQMDLYNNKLGIKLGKENPNLSTKKLVELVKIEILKGNALIINKNKSGEFLSRKGEIIPKQKHYRKWYTPINLVYSNKKRQK